METAKFIKKEQAKSEKKNSKRKKDVEPKPDLKKKNTHLSWGFEEKRKW